MRSACDCSGVVACKKRFTVPAPSAIFSVSDILGICFLARLYAAAVSIVRCCGASMRLEATRMADDRMLDEPAFMSVHTT